MILRTFIVDFLIIFSFGKDYVKDYVKDYKGLPQRLLVLAV